MSYTPTCESQTKDQVVLFIREECQPNTDLTCEYIAIKKAIQTCLDRPQNTLICTDSKSWLISLKTHSQKIPVSLDIQDKTHTDTQKGTDLAFVWVPGHRGIAGNEKTDKGAKQAAKQVPILEPLSLADMDRYLKDTVWRLWQDEWNISTTQLRALKTDVRTTEDGSRQLTRRERVVLNRLRLGHTQLTHSHLLTNRQQPQSDFCGTAVISDTYILQDCHCLNSMRQVHGIKSLTNAQQMKNENYSRLFDFF